MVDDWQKYLDEEEKRDLKLYRYTTEPVYRTLAISRALVRAKDRGLLKAMPVHADCLARECPCMPGRTLALTESDFTIRRGGLTRTKARH